MPIKKLPKTIDEFVKKSSDFKDALKDPICWSKIPLLNYTSLKQLRDGDLVRYRGMVQDMWNTEIYMKRCEIHSRQQHQVRIQYGKYRESIVLMNNEYVQHDAYGNLKDNRRPIVVVALPAINAWASHYEWECNKLVLENRNNNQMEIGELPENDENNEANSSKKVKLADDQNNDDIAIAEYSGQECIVKLYDHFDDHALNSIIDVIGFLAFEVEAEKDDEPHVQDKNFKTKVASARVPIVHAIAVHKLPHYNPLLDNHLMATTNAQYAFEGPLNMQATQQELLKFLSLCLFNDNLTAEYLLCHLISTIYNRTEMECGGKCSLNICNLMPNRNNQELENAEQIPNTNYTERLYEILQMLLPASKYLSMDINILNTTKFLPKYNYFQDRKDYESGKIVTGILQLPAHTHLVLDETCMQPGNLEDNGVRGIQALTRLINHQQISCDFQFYQLDYNVNIPVLVLSEGRSMLPHDFIVPIEADDKSVAYINETLAAAHHYLQTENRLNKFRRFLTKARTADFKITAHAIVFIHEDFQTLRSENIIEKPEELHGFIVLARLVAIARGTTELRKESWNYAKHMEIQRKERVAKLPKSKMATATAQAVLATNGC